VARRHKEVVMIVAKRIRRAMFVALLLIPVVPASSSAQDEPAQPKKLHSCNDAPGYHEMDFWLGEWDVKLGQRVVGSNRIHKMLKGCAIMEHWTARDGSEGKSLFYYDGDADVWKQVWVTDMAWSPGGLKEKVLVERMPRGGLRFQGEITQPNGEVYMDRTTLTPNPDGTVRQWIQVSTDGGEMWTSTFDATYVRKGAAEN
jgi:hypothetical protein